MKMAGVVKILAVLIVTAWLTSCGSGNSSSGNNSGSNGGNSSGYLFGERLGVSVYMQPGPPAYTFPPSSGTSPGIQIDQVEPFSSTANPSGTDINQATTQVVFGQVTGSTSGESVVVYSLTNQYYIQPLTSTTINISGNSTWIAPASAGQISALLIAQGYTPPNTTATLPVVDGVNVLAVATQP
jgi:hypothetical protein